MTQAAYDLDGVRYAYPCAPGGFSLELDQLRIGAGDVLALVGPNGAGKTTLLMMLSFLIRPSRGRLGFFGADPWTGEGQPVLSRREAVLVTQHPYLFKGTIFDNLAFGLRVRGVPESQWGGRVGQALALVELGGWERRAAAGLSAGQAQRVALARALALRPKALLLDEPTANIDAGLSLRIEAIIREISREAKTTVVFSTHDFSQASRLADGFVYLSEGRQVEFSHENCFSGTAGSDGRGSWIEPVPGARISFQGAVSGHVTCVIDPADIRLFPAQDTPAASGPNMFRGRIVRMETTDDDSALVRVCGSLTFRVTIPLREAAARGISLSQPVLIQFKPEAVALIGPRPPDKAP